MFPQQCFFAELIDDRRNRRATIQVLTQGRLRWPAPRFRHLVLEKSDADVPEKNDLWNVPLNTLLEASGAGAFVIAAAGWQVRSAIRRRRARRRPTASILSDAIIVGSNSPRDAARPNGTRLMHPAVGELERLSESADQWGFSLTDADRVICTFVYPGREQAVAAQKAMRRAKKDLAAMELHAARI